MTAPLRHKTEPFDDPDWIYEIKHDGFRAIAMIERGQCRFVSRKHQQLSAFRTLAEALVQEVKARTPILDGELVVPDEHRRSIFTSMMKGAGHDVRYFAFDLLWLNGVDLRELPALRRKAMLKQILPSRSPNVLYVDHTTGDGRWLYHRACEMDLEGIVANIKPAPTRTGSRVMRGSRSKILSTVRRKDGMNGSIVCARRPERLEQRSADVCREP